MTTSLTPQAALYGDAKPLPSLPLCVHYAGSEKFLAKALELQAERGPVFDISCDCEDGAPVGLEARAREDGCAADRCARRIATGAWAHASMTSHHAAWHGDLEILVGDAGDRIAFLTLPKAEAAGDVERMLAALATETARAGVARQIPVSVLIETPGAAHDAWAIAALPGVISLDFGTHGFRQRASRRDPAVRDGKPGAVRSPLVRRAKADVAAAALAHGVVPVHRVTRALDEPDTAYNDARRARDEFGFLRMWSIHPSQIEPIVRALQPSLEEIDEATQVLVAAQGADWAPLRVAGKLHDRASYRYCWSVVSRAHAAGVPLPAAASVWFA